MDPVDVTRAIDVTLSIATDLGLPAETAALLHDSNRIALRILPCDVLARVAHVGREVGALEIEVAQRLTEVGAPAGTLDPPPVHCPPDRSAATPGTLR